MTSIRLILFTVLVGLNGCFSLAREEPTRQTFVLGGRDGQEMVMAAEKLTGVRIGIRQLRISGYLESPLIVVRQGSNQIHYSEFNRWGGELKSAVKSALAGYLTALAPLGGVDVAPWDSRAAHDYLIQVHLIRLEGLLPGDPMDARAEALVLADWEIIHPQDGSVLVRGSTNYKSADWNVGEFGSLVEGLDTGLRQLSSDLIAALLSLEGTD